MVKRESWPNLWKRRRRRGSSFMSMVIYTHGFNKEMLREVLTWLQKWPKVIVISLNYFSRCLFYYMLNIATQDYTFALFHLKDIIKFLPHKEDETSSITNGIKLTSISVVHLVLEHFIFPKNTFHCSFTFFWHIIELFPCQNQQHIRI